ncbi:MAG TPA: hypothetical protein VEC95_00095, partial [Terriglobales bacterium]|nr:hypothetical protein [Terriglobales bacterium]
MVRKFDKPGRTIWILIVLTLALIFGANSLAAQAIDVACCVSAAQAQPQEKKPPASAEPETRITPDQAQE